MLNLSNEPPKDGKEQPYPILRVPAHGNMLAIFTSQKPIGCSTHFWGHRTVPCTDPHCDACDAGAARRWHGYAAAYSHLNQLHFILEFTVLAAEKIYAYLHEHGTLRGCSWKAYRVPATPNGRCHMQTATADLSRYNIPEPPSLPKILARLWNIPLNEIIIPDDHDAIQTANAVYKRTANQPPLFTPGNGDQ